MWAPLPRGNAARDGVRRWYLQPPCVSDSPRLRSRCSPEAPAYVSEEKRAASTWWRLT